MLFRSVVVVLEVALVSLIVDLLSTCRCCRSRGEVCKNLETEGVIKLYRER